MQRPRHPALHGFAYGLDFLREQVLDVQGDDLVAQPAGVANHPAWTIGHLVSISQLFGGVLGVEPWLPAEWAGRYGSGTAPVADAALYEGKVRLLDRLQDAQRRLTEAVESRTDAELDAPFPDPRHAHVFPTVRHAVTQVLVGHTAFHVGQVAVWRRAMGLPGPGRAFE